MYDYLIVGAGLYGAVFADKRQRSTEKYIVSIDNHTPNVCGKCVYGRE